MNGLDRAGLARLLSRPATARVLAALVAPGEETRLVGGSVRDALLGRPSADLDLATTLEPPAVVAAARAAGLRSIPTGIDHGTVTLLADGEPFEVTTLREDIETDGRHAVVRFGRDFVRDAERRDFTINALSLGADGVLHDAVGGVADLAAGRVRFIGEAQTRIREDALRVLRFFRFHARYGAGAPDAEGLAACIGARDALGRLSRERIRAELLKLLVAPGAVAAVTILSETGLLVRLVGGLGDLGRFARAVAGEGSAIERLAGLCAWSEADAERLREALRLSNAETRDLAAICVVVATLHGRELIEEPGLRALAAEHGPAALAAALAITSGEPRPRLDEGSRAAAIRWTEEPQPDFPIAGADLVARGLAPGPRVGRALKAARLHWLSLGCPSGEAIREVLIARALDEA